MTVLIPFLSSALTLILGVSLSYFVSRRKAAAEVYKIQQEGDAGYAGMAKDAWHEVQVLHSKLRLHEKRWRLALVILEECSRGLPRLTSAVDEIRTLNHLQEIDG